MQTTTAQFDSRASGNMRPVSGSVFISFDKVLNDDVEFFTLDQSMLDSGDILQGEADAVAIWDKYQYVDYSNRLLSLEWTRQEDPVASVVLATADISLDNHDNYFTPESGSAIDDYILPKRPVRLYAGFKGENLPVFVGLTEAMPVIDDKNKTASFHCIDFLQYLFNKPLEETVLYQNMRTDEILSDLLFTAGLLPSQYILDTGFNIVPYAYFPRKTKFGDAVKELMVAEQGRFYMDENGVIRFKNRQNYPTTAVMSLNGSNVLEDETIKFDEIVNVVELEANIRQEQEFQKLWELADSVLIPAGGSVDIWAEFQDPVTEAVAPVYVDSATESYYMTNENAAGTGTAFSGNISLSSSSLFSTSLKMTFANSGVDTYVTNIEIFGVPIKVIDKLQIREVDQNSIDKYEEHVLPISNDYLQNEDQAVSKALVLLDDYSEYNKAQGLVIKGNPALQVGDMVNVGLQAPGEYIITKITGKLMDASFKQELAVKQFVRRIYFTLDESALDGGAQLAP